MYVDIGVASYPDLPLSELIQRSRDIKVDFIEVVLEGEYHRETLVNRVTEIDQLLDDKLDLIIHLPFGGIDTGSPFDHVRSGAVQELKANIQLASKLGAKKAVFHAETYVHPAVWEKQTVVSSLIDSIRELVDFASEYNIELGIENVPNPFIDITDFPKLFEESSVNATLDTGHSRVNQISHITLTKLLETHSDRFTHFHLNDTRSTSDDHLPVGMGTTDFVSLFQSLPDDWAGSMTVEAITTDFEYMAKGVENLRDQLAML
jgi:sugar phosphate isomerase/epimerase